jgi:beta-lactamase regulating signal transducer with metallopeptidase domain
MWTVTLLPHILNMSFTAGVVIVLVLGARLMLKKAPKIFSYALWAVVLFRLVCPVSFSSQFSLFGLFPASASTTSSGAASSMSYIPADVVYAAPPQENLPVPGAPPTVSEALPKAGEQTPADPLKIWITAGTYLWLSGIAVMLIYSALSLIRLRRKLVGAVHLRDNIYLADHVASPFVIGVIRPRIYLPSTLPQEEQSYVVLHEQTHIRRLDHIVKMLAFLALAVHWFNPLVWAAFVCAVKDMEMSCDERVLKQMGDDIKSAYGASLLSLATGRRLINGSPLAFGEGNIKGRIRNVMNFKKPAAWVVVVSVLLVAALSVGFAANKASDSKVGLPENTGPFVGYEKDTVTDTFDVYTKVGGSYIMSLPYSIFNQFPASDRADQKWQPGWMNVDVYCGSIKGFKWAVVCTGPSAGMGNADVCTSTDGGRSWWVGDRNAMYPGTVTGAGFASSKVGFMSYRYFIDQGPEISRTLDGGKTWKRMTVDIPDNLKEYRMTPLVPTFTGLSGTYPIELYDNAGNSSVAYLTTVDGGMTWQWKKSNMMVAYIDETLSETDARALQSRIEQVPNVEHADFETKEAATKKFEDTFPDKSLSGLIEPSVFRNRYYIYLRDTSLIEQTADEILRIAGVSKVSVMAGAGTSEQNPVLAAPSEAGAFSTSWDRLRAYGAPDMPADESEMWQKRLREDIPGINSYEVGGIYSNDFDKNGKADLTVLLHSAAGQSSQSYLCVYMNDDPIYEKAFGGTLTAFGFMQYPFSGDVDNDGCPEIVYNIFTGGNGGAGSSVKGVLKYKDRTFVPLELPGDNSESFTENNDVGYQVKVLFGKGENEYKAVCGGLGKTVDFQAQNAVNEDGTRARPYITENEEAGANCRGYSAFSVVSRNGGNCLLAEEYLYGEGGSSHGVGFATFLIEWDGGGSPHVSEFGVSDKSVRQAAEPSEPSETRELIARADVNQDGKEENIYLDKSQMNTTFDVTILVTDQSGNERWREALNTAHAGWDQIFLCNHQGAQYLLRYNPHMGQGYCTYVYSLFSPEAGGKESVSQTKTLEFDINGSKALDARKMTGFADEVNALLKSSVLLISSNGGAWSFGPASAEPFYERYSWLDGSPELFSDGDSLETKLEKYSDWAIANRN